MTATRQGQKEEEKQQEESEGAAQLPSHLHNQVIVTPTLGFKVSGVGKADPARSLTAIQEGIERSQSDLQSLYDGERSVRPTAMGSLILDLTIEPDGRPSRVRLQSAKFLSRDFQHRVLTLASTWRFSPAAGRVRVFYPLLFLSSDMDPHSIAAWESGAIETR